MEKVVKSMQAMAGKKYSIQKYVNVIIITTGVALFMGGGKSSQKKDVTEDGNEAMYLGALMLSVSLCFDGATGAYEDNLMEKDHVEPFDLMYNIQLGKAVISFCCLVATNGLNEFFQTIQEGGISLFILGLTGALGQVFVFVTISKFGALNCALIGLGRKMLSLLLSFVLYGHQLNAFQTVGLTLSLAAMIANFYEKSGGKGKHGHHPPTVQDQHEAARVEKVALLAPDNSDDEADIEPGRSKHESMQDIELLDLTDINISDDHRFDVLPDAKETSTTITGHAASV
eukprot:scaffold1088_cov177-Ochromonas_danica.AAC.8